ncbi:transglycosylase SLT domain-containing protein [Ursidibacter arcticus]
MWQKTFLALWLTSAVTMAANVNQVSTSEKIVQDKQQWLAEQKVQQKQLRKQRENFLIVELLLQAAIKQGKVSAQTLALAEKLVDRNYPLQEEIDWLFFKAKMLSDGANEGQNRIDWTIQFSQKYPEIAKRNQLSQNIFEHYYQQQKFAELIAYAERNPAQTLQNHCRLFSAQYQLLAEKILPNPEAEQATNSSSNSPELALLLQKFDEFWVNSPEIEPNYWKNNDKLPSECNGIVAFGRDQGFLTDEKIKNQAVRLLKQNAKQGLAYLSLNYSKQELSSWFNDVKNLLDNVSYLPMFIQNQPLDQWNKTIVLDYFPKFIRTLSEQQEQPSFEMYQQWAEKYQLTIDELKEWKVSFISRLFDHNDPIFQLWRDEQLQELKVDSLTERRLRLAILQKVELKPWLALLSDEAKSKQEWRYWQAKTEPTQEQQRLLEKLAQERGFYPMLAANQLNQPYELTLPTNPSLTETQYATFKAPLDRIAELRELARFGSAKLAWIELLKAVSFDEKLALTQYATQQEWFDLAVEGTIQAKAWDYINLRLPNAYADWFEINLANQKIPQSFAMAIARQESAWNFQARSHANAMGLMQLLPSTAKATANNAELPYSNERELFEPFQNIMLGTTHLAELNEKYPNNRILIAAAYNAGASRVERWLQRADGKLAMDEFIATIPFLETRGYVQNVLAYDFYYQTLYGKGEKKMFNQEELRIY